MYLYMVMFMFTHMTLHQYIFIRLYKDVQIICAESGLCLHVYVRLKTLLNQTDFVVQGLWSSVLPSVLLVNEGTQRLLPYPGLGFRA